MPPKKKTPKPAPTTAAPVSSYKHDATRKRIPTQEESVKLSRREKQPVKKTYAYDPSLDPQLTWSGKQEQGAEFDIPTVPIYVQEHVAPEALIARLKSGASDDRQMLLFGETAEDQFQKAVEFYKHEDNWQNRLILGDSLLVMNSLLEKEGMRGKVQTVYMDPPYGIKFGSNWQVSTRNRDVKNNKVEDFIRQPEQVKAFRDTWELGIHSYLSYLRDRLITARELLNESGSCFVQISDENVHLVRNVMDEVFGNENFVSIVPFRKKLMPLGSKTLEGMCDFLIWYSKSQDQLKYRALYKETTPRIESRWTNIELPNGTRRKLSAEEGKNLSLLPAGSRIYRLVSQRAPSFTEQTVYDFEFNGKVYKPPKGGCWVTTKEKMELLKKQNRLEAEGDNLSYVYYHDDFPYQKINNFWDDTAPAQGKEYVVQTSNFVIERCLLMTTDPGDIVLDPTCGSGTTAYVAEQWGRRWITTDTSRVALQLARTRLMTAKYPYYRLKSDLSFRGSETTEKSSAMSKDFSPPSAARNDKSGPARISDGFEYQTVPHVTLKSLANDEEPDTEILYDKPLEDKKIVRVAGPFTVESLSPHRVSDGQEMVNTERFVNIVIENLLKAGVQTGEKGARLEFVNLDVLPSGPEVQAVGEYKTKDGMKKAAVAIGPEFGSVDDDFIRDAATVAARFADLLVVAATSFDASAHSVNAKDLTGFQNLSDLDFKIMKVKINPDLSMGDLLKKTGSGNLFLAFGEPEVKVHRTADLSRHYVEILGVDVYDPVKSELRSSGSGNLEHDIAAWFIDTNYSGEAFFVTHAYFLGADKPFEKLKKALKADIHEDLWDELYSTVSRPFPKPKTGKIAVKVINHYGDEVMKVVEVR
ncbi:MAG: site-specific DNA-methyltransferase [Anaerolineales bacterium]|nr:site-specific DNA-methyltransferase [Anaerolineales bacterium]